MGRQVALSRAVRNLPNETDGWLIWKEYYAKHADLRKTTINIVKIVADRAEIPNHKVVIGKLGPHLDQRKAKKILEALKESKNMSGIKLVEDTFGNDELTNP